MRTFLRPLARRLLPLAATFLAGCVSIDEIAPPVATLAPGSGGSLGHGRDLYLTRCTRCHSAEPVRNYSSGQWATILPDMIERTRLANADAEALRDYVRAVLAR